MADLVFFVLFMYSFLLSDTSIWYSMCFTEVSELVDSLIFENYIKTFTHAFSRRSLTNTTND